MNPQQDQVRYYQEYNRQQESASEIVVCATTLKFTAAPRYTPDGVTDAVFVEKL